MLRLEEARAIKEKLYGKESVEVAATLDNLGLVYSRMGDLTLALASCGAAQKTRDVLLGRVHRESAKSRLNLAAVLLQLSDHDGAMRVWGEAVDIFSELGETSMEVAKALNNMATVEEERGRDREALVLHKKALEIKLREAPQSLAVADSLYNMSMLYEKSHLYTEAVEACQRSLALATECGGRDHPSALEARDLLRELKHLSKQGH